MLDSDKKRITGLIYDTVVSASQQKEMDIGASLLHSVESTFRENLIRKIEKAFPASTSLKSNEVPDSEEPYCPECGGELTSDLDNGDILCTLCNFRCGPGP